MEGLLSTGPTLSSLSKKIQILKIAQLKPSQDSAEQHQSKGAKEDSGRIWLVGTLWLAGMF